MAVETFTVKGMSCSHCEASVREEVLEVPGVEAVTADHETGAVEVTGEGYSREDIAAAVEEAGYTLA